MGKTKILSSVKQLWRSVAEVVFPPLCWHCEAKAKKLSAPLCDACLSLLEFLPITSSVIATFEKQGPIEALMRSFKSGRAPRLAAALAGFMAVQYTRSEHALPDLLIAVPQSMSRFFEIGYNPSLLLAQQLGKIFQRPAFSPLKRKFQIALQAKLEPSSRQKLSSHSFQWAHHLSIQGKRVLLVDDTIGTGATLRGCMRTLSEGLPMQMVGLTCLQESLSNTNYHNI